MQREDRATTHHLHCSARREPEDFLTMKGSDPAPIMMYFFFVSVFHVFATECGFSLQSISTLFFSMKVAKTREIVFVSCIIDFKEIHVCCTVFSLNLSAYGVMIII
jgi:hypothetical protein